MKVRELGLSVFVEVRTEDVISDSQAEKLKKAFRFYNVEEAVFDSETQEFITVLSFYFNNRYEVNNDDMKKIKKQISEILK